MLKKLMILVILMMTMTIFNSVSACGIGGTSGGSKIPWEELKRCEQLSYITPRLLVENKKLSVFNICQTETKIRSKEPVKIVCDQNDNCMEIYLYRSKFQEISKCKELINYRCSDNGEEEIKEVSTNFEIQVFKTLKNGLLKLLFKKIYTLPICQN